MLGRTLGHYQIVAELGRGGMGVVYRAKDTALGRDVALKVLPETLTADPDRLARFDREARAVAALSHPNILAIYDLGNEGGLFYAVMELLVGETLRDRLRRGPPAQALIIVYGAQIARGVSAAHERGIIHRDLKPENIFITESNQIKVLDFGLAKFDSAPVSATGAAAVTEPQLTQPGLIFGTVDYMSPEQVRGLPVDRRSDIFSLGTILHELVSGHRPFQRDSMPDTMLAIVHDAAPSIPGPLAPIIRRCLEKKPDDRFQSAIEVAGALESMSGRPARPLRRKIVVAGGAAALVAASAALARTLAPRWRHKDRERIVVLPFENLGLPENEYFASGITEEITGRLAVVSGLGVISRASALHYGKSAKTASQVGQELDVDYILEGAVRWEKGGRVRVTPQLIRVSDDTHIWAETYDRVVEEIFEVQSDIAAKVIHQIDVVLLGTERRALQMRPTPDPGAYQAYLKGMHYMEESNHYAEEGLQRAIEMFERAVALDPHFALAFARLGQAQAITFHSGHDRSEDLATAARNAVGKAIELDPDLPEARVALADYHCRVRHDFPNALADLDVAEKIQPDNTDILGIRAAIRRRQGNVTDAIAILDKAFRLNPVDGHLLFNQGLNYTSARRYADAERYYDLAIATTEDEISPSVFKAWNRWLKDGGLAAARAALAWIPRTEDLMVARFWFVQCILERNYRAALDRLAAMKTEQFLQWELWYEPKPLLTAQVHGLLGDREAARTSYDAARLLLEREVTGTRDIHRVHAALGLAYAGLGRKDDAIREGRRAVELHPVTFDALSGPIWELNLAAIYTMVGDRDAALAQLDHVLSVPAYFSVAMLKLDPAWDALREAPAYRRLVDKYS